MVEVTREAMRKALYSKVSLGVIEWAADPDSGAAGSYALADAISDALGIPQAEPEALGAVIYTNGYRYIATNRAPGTRRWVRVFDVRNNCSVVVNRWDEFDSRKVEVVK